MIKIKVETLEKKSVQIFRMSTLDLHNKPVMWVSAFLIDGLLIDGGHHHARNELIKNLPFENIEYCVLSHHHEDHFGVCHYLIEKYNIPIYSNIATAFLVKMKLKLPPERRLTWGVPTPLKVNGLINSKELNTSKAKFKVITSPGHCSNLLSFFHVKKRLLFSTDAFVNKNQSVIFNWENANVMLDTFKHFKSLNFKYAFLEDGSLATPKDVNGLTTYWYDLQQQSENLYQNGFTSKQIVRKIFGKESIFKIMTGGDISRENLIRSLLKLPPLDKRKSRKTKAKK